MTNEEIATTLTRHESSIEALTSRVDKAEAIIDEIRELTTSVQLIAQKQSNIDEKIDTLTVTVRELDSKPKERWESVVKTLITVVVTALATGAVAAIIEHMH